MDVGSLVRAAEHASTMAGRYLVEQLDRGHSVRLKSSPHDVVTDADAAAELLIRRELTAVCPGSAVVGEELGASARAEVCWYVDPIDGTYNFVRGIPLFCVSIGLEVRGRIVGGCVYDPVRDELFSAHGATLWRNGCRIPTGSAHHSGGLPAIVVTDIPGEAGSSTELAVFTDLIARAEVRRIGSSALALAYVACGRADVAANTDVYPWDVVAGHALVAAARGGIVTVPERLRTDRRGGFIAWRPGFEQLASELIPTVTGLVAVR